MYILIYHFVICQIIRKPDIYTLKIDIEKDTNIKSIYITDA